MIRRRSSQRPRRVRSRVRRLEVVISIRSRLDSIACFGEAARSARKRLPSAALTNIRSVPAVGSAPYPDTLCRRRTAFPSFAALLTAAGGYRPSIRLDLTGPEGGTLARAYDGWQTRWGDRRRACVWPAQ